MLTHRRGATLLELVVALVVGSVILGAAVQIAVRQQRFHRDVLELSARADQVGQTAALIPVELRGLAAGDDDIADARDTAIQFRATVAASIVCDTVGGQLVLAPATADRSIAGYLDPPRVGDSIWFPVLEDSAERWEGRAVAAVASIEGGCTIGGMSVVSGAWSAVRIFPDRVAPAEPGMPVRITRWTRYSVYRAGDGAWYLGFRDWNHGLARYNTVQPVSGPFRSTAATGLRFAYLDSAGSPVTADAAGRRRIARIEVALLTDSGRATPFTLLAATARSRGTVALRNRRRE
jgi:prepilin-type N-terminal cleavage/methylation domain-containing protein